tara:strand:+ start:417 stop:695 length:279 start_codon:yes stop_codon:yes gene_type:complete
MKITKRHLKRIIKEEKQRLIENKEAAGNALAVAENAHAEAFGDFLDSLGPGGWTPEEYEGKVLQAVNMFEKEVQEITMRIRDQLEGGYTGGW